MPPRSVTLQLSFAGANPNPAIEGFSPLETNVSYFIGDDPDRWHTAVPAWGGVRYSGLYSGLDLEIAPSNGRWAWRFVSRLGLLGPSLLSPVRLRVDGADALLVDNGQLQFQTAVGSFALPLLDASSAEMNGRWPILESNQVLWPFASPGGDVLPLQNPSQSGNRPTDLLYSTFLGGSNDDYGNAIALGPGGEMYITGGTNSNGFSGQGANYVGGLDVFVAKLNRLGNTLEYLTYLGGGADDVSQAIAVDSSGKAYLTGYTYKSTTKFPTLRGAYTNYAQSADAFVARLESSGALNYGTYLGGNGWDSGWGIALLNNVAYVGGAASSTNFPRKNALDSVMNGGRDGFVAKVDPAQSGLLSLLYSSYFGGSGYDQASGIAVNGAGEMYLSGSTTGSPDQNDPFPTPGGFDQSHGGGYDGFIAKLNASGSSVLYSTFLGGSANDCEVAGEWRECPIAVDSSGIVYVAGMTASDSGFLPSGTNGYAKYYEGGRYDGFLIAVQPGSMPFYATYFGGNDDDRIYGLGLDPTQGVVVVSGWTRSDDFPYGVDIDRVNTSDAFVAKVDTRREAEDSLLYASYLGGNDFDSSSNVTAYTDGVAHLVGTTYNPGNFPTQDPYDPDYNEATDTFVAKVLAPVPPAWSITRYVTEGMINDLNLVYRQGCNEGLARRGKVIVVLNFGYPGIEEGVGAYLLDTVAFVPRTRIVDVVKSFIGGYWDCTTGFPEAQLMLAMGVNNFDSHTGSTHGQQWATMVNEVAEWVFTALCFGSITCSYSDRVTIAGAIDIEEWKHPITSQVQGDHVRTVEWAEAYAATTTNRYFNFGTCEACVHGAPSSFLNPFHDYTWYVSWGIPNAFPLPEIYNVNGVNAEQWRNLSYYAATCTNCQPATMGLSGRIHFLGTLTQWRVCRYTPTSDRCRDAYNSPSSGWQQLFQALYAYSETRQPSLQWSTDIRWGN